MKIIARLHTDATLASADWAMLADTPTGLFCLPAGAI
jgi:hypothetical protein